MSGAQVQWSGDREVAARMMEYQRRVKQAVQQVAEYWAAVFEAYAKENAPWTDRTGNARQSLWTEVRDLARDTVALYLSHGVEYGVQLETRFGGRYAIIWPTMEAHLSQIGQMLRGIFG